MSEEMTTNVTPTESTATDSSIANSNEATTPQ